MATNTETYAITGIKPDKNAKWEYYTQGDQVPYATGLPQRREITDWFEEIEAPGSADGSKKAHLQKQWTLFILALEKFKSLTVSDKLSYFQVAGIHGYPETPWDNAPPPKQDPQGDPSKAHPGSQPFGGYCHHNTVAFPTWHRPYMLLFEQCIWDNMQKVIAEQNLQPLEAWQDAANSWRLPYWDWGLKQKYPDDHSHQWNDFGIPYLMTVPQIPIYSNGREMHDNPLVNFVNPEKDPQTKMPLPMGQMPADKAAWNIKDDIPYDSTDESYPWSECRATSRWGILLDPTTKKHSGYEGVNDFVKANNALATMQSGPARDNSEKPIVLPPRWYQMSKARMTDEEWQKYQPRDLADTVNRLFTEDYNNSWSTFSSTKWYREWQGVHTGFLSLEYIHNNVHNITGGYTASADPKRPGDIFGLGHMCDVPVAAFDPIFWLHHCNIDRYTALWQALNWEKWFDGKPDPNQKIPIPGTNPVVYFPGPLPDISPDEHLVPFHTAPTEKEPYWTSNMAKDWTKLGYVYDDMQALTEMPGCVDIVDGKPKLNLAVYQEYLKLYINYTYPGSSTQAWKIRVDDNIDNHKFFGKIEEQPWYEDYVINVIYDRYALKGSSYSIRFYLGDAKSSDEVSTSSVRSARYVGQVYSLGGMRIGGQGGEGGCINCSQQNDLRTLSKGQVPLSISMMQLAADPNFTAVNSMKQSDVISYIEKNLRFEFVQGGGGNIRPASDFPETVLTVLGGIAVASTPTEIRGEKSYKPPVYHSNSYTEFLTANKGNGWVLTKTPRFEYFDGADKEKTLEDIGPAVAKQVQQSLLAQQTVAS